MWKMNVLVEDDITKPPYKLLVGKYGHTIMGSKGNHKIVKFMIDNNIENAIVYIDVVADNYQTVEIYNETVQIAKELNNVYVVPIPCIEFYFICAFIGYSTKESNAALTFSDYRKYTSNYRKRTLITTADFEKFCKSIFRNHISCFQDKFLKKECKCHRSVNNLCEERLTLENKTKRFIDALPVSELVMNLTMCGITEFIIQDIKSCEKIYYKMAENFQQYGIIDFIVPLDSQF